MDFGNDLLGALRERMGMTHKRAMPAHPDWASLHACCTAAHAARTAILRELASVEVRRGSFGPATANRLLAENMSSTAVNPTALDDGKQLSSIAVGIHGTHLTGGRGL